MWLKRNIINPLGALSYICLMKGHSLGSAGTQLVSVTAGGEFALSDNALGFPELGTQRVILDYWLKNKPLNREQNEKVFEKFLCILLLFLRDGFISFGDKITVKLLKKASLAEEFYTEKKNT